MPSSMPSPARRIGTTSGRGSLILTPVVVVTGRADLDRLDPHVARRLVGEQRHELFGELPEHRRRGALVPQDRELVGDERVVGDVYTHRLESTEQVALPARQRQNTATTTFAIAATPADPERRPERGIRALRSLQRPAAHARRRAPRPARRARCTSFVNALARSISVPPSSLRRDQPDAGGQLHDRPDQHRREDEAASAAASAG